MNAEELRERLAELDPAALTDADKSIRVIDSAIRPIQTGVRLFGPARTVRCDSDFFAVIRALDAAQAGDVLVIDTQGSRVAVVGELFTLEAARRGLGGIVIDGAARDISTIRNTAMPVYARSITPVSGTVATLGELQVPITCGGVNIAPGDMLFGDDDGIIVASGAQLAALIPAAANIKATENAVIARLGRGDNLMSMLNVAAHRAALERGDDKSKLQFSLNGEGKQ